MGSICIYFHFKYYAVILDRIISIFNIKLIQPFSPWYTLYPDPGHHSRSYSDWSPSHSLYCRTCAQSSCWTLSPLSGWSASGQHWHDTTRRLTLTHHYTVENSPRSWYCDPGYYHVVSFTSLPLLILLPVSVSASAWSWSSMASFLWYKARITPSLLYWRSSQLWTWMLLHFVLHHPPQPEVFCFNSELFTHTSQTLPDLQ